MKNLSKVVLKPLKRKSSNLCSHNQNREDAKQKHLSMTPCFTKGFTLIELLVVVLIIGVLAIFVIMLTEFTSNTASASLLIPIFASLSTALNLPPSLLTLVIALGGSCAFMLPVATPPNAIVFGTGYIRQIEMIRAGVWLGLFSVVMLIIFGVFIWE